jgi:hypothetical protein
MATISQYLIDRYSAGPSASRTSAVASLQNSIRDVLGEGDWDTFLQGSYRNDTAIADINDVDILARRKATTAPLSAPQWETLFNTIASKLRGSYRISGTVSLGDKCVNLKGTSLNADIVPAAAIGDFGSDPIAIWSRRQRVERPNYPRAHYDNGVSKQRRTSNSYKATVRLFKRWVRQYSGFGDFAPSFYTECAVHEASDGNFSTYLPQSFLQVGREICSWTRYKRINSVAGDKDILVATEWSPEKFETFKARLAPELCPVSAAITAYSTAEADRLWKRAFGE